MLVYCCPRCKSVDLGDANEEKMCARCHTPMFSLGISSKEWNSFDNEQMKEVINLRISEYENTTIKQPVWDEEQSDSYEEDTVRGCENDTTLIKNNEKESKHITQTHTINRFDSQIGQKEKKISSSINTMKSESKKKVIRIGDVQDNNKNFSDSNFFSVFVRNMFFDKNRLLSICVAIVALIVFVVVVKVVKNNKKYDISDLSENYEVVSDAQTNTPQSEPSATPTLTPTSTPTPTPTPTPSPTPTPTKVIIPGISDLEYKRIEDVLKVDLYKAQTIDKQGGNLNGKDALTYGRIYNNPSQGYIQISVPDTYHGIDCYLAKDSDCVLSDLSENDIVIIAGTITGSSDALFFQQVQMTDCYVIAIIFTSKLDHNAIDKVISQIDSDYKSLFEHIGYPMEDINFDTMGQEASGSGNTVNNPSDSSPVTSNSFDMEIGSKTYGEIVRNPEQYKGTRVKFSGKIDQILNDSMLGFATSYWSLICTDGGGNKYRISYKYMEGESHKREGDRITVYGKLNGNAVGQTLLGSSMEMPEIDADSIE